MISVESYLKQLEANGKSEKTVYLYGYVLKRLNEYKPLDQITKDDLVEFFKTFEGTAQTKRLMQSVVKKFFKENEKEDLVNWIQLVKVKIITSDKDTLMVEDINKMIEETTSPYWKAYISVLFETGARFSELKACKWSDFKNNNLEITTTKPNVGTRKIPLNMSGNYLTALRMNQKALDDALIFPYTEGYVRPKLNEIAVSAGIEKPANPHKFRHSRATDLVRRGTQETIIRKILGWTPDSAMIARYQHTNDNSIIDYMNGKSTESIANITHVENPIEDLKKENEELQVKVAGADNQLLELSEANEWLKSNMIDMKNMMSYYEQELRELKEGLKTKK